jgi:nitroreductase
VAACKGTNARAARSIRSRRPEVRSYAERPLPPEVAHRILEAGRVTGSSRNLQARRFIVLERTMDDAAGCVFAAANVRGAALAVAIVVRSGGQGGFDAGRAAQSMMLAAWNDGVGSCPNGIADADALARVLALGYDERVAIIVSFGYPARPLDPQSRVAEKWIERADRRPFDEVVSRV